MELIELGEDEQAVFDSLAAERAGESLDTKREGHIAEGR